MKKEPFKVSLSIDGLEVSDEVLDNHLAIIEVYVCHDGNNAHNLPIKLETIEAAQETLKNKLEGKYNDYSIECIGAYFAYYYDKMNFARVCYDIYTDKTDLYPARFEVVVPLQLCKK